MTAQSSGSWVRNNRFWRYIDERLGLDQLDYSIPEHGNTLPYMIGGITVFGFVLLIVTGVILTLFYDPSPERANASVLAIQHDVTLGWLVRGVHFWAAQAVIISVVLHMVRVFVTASYKKPRELNWIFGIALLAITLNFYFSGTILKWDQESYQGVAEVREVSGFLGPFGLPVSPDLAPAVPLLDRMVALHIAILPVIIGIFLLAHLLYVHYFNISPLPWRKKASDVTEEPKEPFTKHLIGLTQYGIVLFVIVAILAFVFPAPLGPEPITGFHDATKPPWPLLPLTAVDDLFGLWWIIPGTAIPFLFLLAVPFIDRGEERDPRKRKVIVITFMVGMAILLVLLYLGILHEVAGSVVGG
jgi:ubiquinol-cytochrome c reductase cytochrome b subunit